MTTVSIQDGLIEVDANVVAKGLGMTPEDLQRALRDGTVTSRSETGEAEDAGRFRITFFSASRRMRLVVDATGAVLQQSSADYVRRSAD